MGYRPNRIGPAVASTATPVSVKLPNESVNLTSGANLKGVYADQDLYAFVAVTGGTVQFHHDGAEKFSAMSTGSLVGFGVVIDESHIQSGAPALCNININCVTRHDGGSVTIYPAVWRLDTTRKTAWTGQAVTDVYRSKDNAKFFVPYQQYSPLVGAQHLVVNDTIILPPYDPDAPFVAGVIMQASSVNPNIGVQYATITSRSWFEDQVIHDPTR